MPLSASVERGVTGRRGSGVKLRFLLQIEGMQGTQTLFQAEHSSWLGRNNGTEDLAWRQRRVHRLKLGAFLNKAYYHAVFHFR